MSCPQSSVEDIGVDKGCAGDDAWEYGDTEVLVGCIAGGTGPGWRRGWGRCTVEPEARAEMAWTTRGGAGSSAGQGGV